MERDERCFPPKIIFFVKRESEKKSAGLQKINKIDYLFIETPNKKDEALKSLIIILS